MPSNENEIALLDFIDRSGEDIILFAGIGNVLRKDDGAGVFICNNIKESGKIRKLTVEVGIENYIGKINSMKPDRLVFIDCTHMAKNPGYFRLLKLESTEDQTFNTHNISLKRLTEFFEMPVWLLGIQPEEIDFGESLSDSVKESAERIIQMINQGNRNSTC